MVRTFIQVLALSLVLISSYFLIKGTILLSVQDLAKLSVPRWGYNLDIAKNLTRQQTDTKVGFVLLLSSFLLQLINILWPIRIKDFALDWKGAVIAIAVSILIFFVANSLSAHLYRKSYEQVESILLKR